MEKVERNCVFVRANQARLLIYRNLIRLQPEPIISNSGKTMKLWFKSHKGHEPKLFKSKKLCNLIRFQGGTDYGKTIHGVFTNNRTINLLIRHGWVSLCAIIGGFQLLV